MSDIESKAGCRVRPKTTLRVSNGLGECILWDVVHRQVLWTDITGRTLFIHDPATGSIEPVEFDEELCSFGLIDGSDDLVCGFRSGIALVDRQSGNRQWRYRLPHSDGVRLNDGRVDRQGRFWVGSLMDNEGSHLTDGMSGELYRFDPDGRVTTHLDSIRISNSLCWSPDGKTLYFADTPEREIHSFDFDTRSGTLANRRLFAQTPEDSLPDGSTVDSEGYLWNAQWGRGRVVRYTPEGRIDTVVQLPVSQVTCVSFGGSKLTDLYVTTANVGLSDAALKAEPQAGDVFVFETSVRGLPEERYVSSG